jgi:hypothetical protein
VHRWVEAFVKTILPNSALDPDSLREQCHIGQVAETCERQHVDPDPHCAVWLSLRPGMLLRVVAAIKG